MNTYTFYVGSTDIHDAHDTLNRSEVSLALSKSAEYVSPALLWGVWDGETERTARYDVTLADDATALRVAYALTVLTGNECVMVTRDAIPVQDDFTMASARGYRVTTEHREVGNRTLYGSPVDDPERGGWALSPDVTGDTVAYLVWADAHVSPVA